MEESGNEIVEGVESEELNLRLTILQRRDAKTTFHFYLEGATTAETSFSTYSLYSPMGFFAQQVAGIKKAFLVEIIA